MKFKKDAKPTCSSDLWYDLTDGGYIKPHDFLEEKDAQAVTDAVQVIMDFFAGMEDNGLLEEM